MKLTYILVFILGLISGITINQITKPAQAEIAGMDAYDLKYDYDFKKSRKIYRRRLSGYEWCYNMLKNTF